MEWFSKPSLPIMKALRRLHSSQNINKCEALGPAVHTCWSYCQEPITNEKGYYKLRYAKDLTHRTTLRISSHLREEAERCAEYQGITFSEFLRQAIRRNIYVAKGVEEEVSRQLLKGALGKR